MEADTARPPQSQQGKQAACLNCRRSKIRCNRLPGEARCEKCRHANVDCIVPSHHLGRQKGVKKYDSGVFGKEMNADGFTVNEKGWRRPSTKSSRLSSGRGLILGMVLGPMMPKGRFRVCKSY
jgi:hypothetical protein